MSSLSTEQLKQALLQLREEGYMAYREGSYRLTEKGHGLFHEAHAPAVQQPLPVPAVAGKDWTLNFITFIQEAKVPKYLENGKGDQYPANNYSEPAMKIFKKAIEKEGIKYDILVKSTMLYYKSQRNRFKKAIANYFIQGDWRSDYKNLLEAAGTGNIEELIKSEIDGPISNYSLG